jgi:hypothetical protein
MKKLIYQISIIVIFVLVIFSCQYDFDKDDPIIKEPNSTGLEGNWIAIKVELQNESSAQDVSEYFKEFKMDINKKRSSWNINGCTSWIAATSWEKEDNFYCNYFKNQDTGCVLFFNIVSIQGSLMTAMIRNDTPAIKFFPEEKNYGNYMISFVPE